MLGYITFLISFDYMLFGKCADLSTTQVAEIMHDNLSYVAIAHDNEWEYLLSGWGSTICSKRIECSAAYDPHGQRSAQPQSHTGADRDLYHGGRNNLEPAENLYLLFQLQIYQETPYWKEVWLTITLFAFYFLTSRFLVCQQPIVFDWHQSPSSSKAV